MDSNINLVSDLALIFISAGIITLVFRWLKQPVILGYLVAGFIIGPHFDLFPGITSDVAVDQWSEIGIIFLLFALGLEFSFKKLLKVGSGALITAGTIFIGMFVAGISIAGVLGWTSMEGVFLGGMLSMSSTTIIIKAFDDLGLKKESFTNLVFGTLIVEDLLAVVLMVLLSTYAVSQHFAGGEMVSNILKLGFFLILWFLVGIFFIPILLKHARKILNEEMLLILSVGLCFGMVVLSTYAGFSPALGAFVMGMILAETLEGGKIVKTIKGVKDLFGAIFFVSVGMMIDPDIIVRYWKPILVLVAVVVLGISVFAILGSLLLGKSLRDSVKTGFSMAQIGEFAFIIAGLGSSLGVMRDYIFPIIIAVSVITTFTTPYLMKFADPFADFLYKILPSGILTRLDNYSARVSGDDGGVSRKEWAILLKTIAVRVVLYSVVLVAVLYAYPKYVEPLLYGLLSPDEHPLASKWMNVLLLLLLISPFIYGLAVVRGCPTDIYHRLWETKSSNRAPLLAIVLFRVLLSIFFVASVFFRYFEFSYWILAIVAIGLALLIFTLRNTYSHLSYVEKTFLENLNEVERMKRTMSPVTTSIKEKLSGKGIYIESIVVSPYSCFVGMPLKDVPFRKTYGVNIVKIKRANMSILIPNSEEILFPYDKIVVIGTEDQIRQFSKVMEADAREVVSEDETNVEPECFVLNDKSYISNKRLGTIDFRGARCMVLGVERKVNGSMESYMNPSPDFIFRPGDIVWMMGERKECEWFV